MTFCSQYSEAIQELVDGTLGPVRRAELQTHLDRCEDCRALVADLKKIRNAATSLDPVRPPDQVWRRIAGQLRQEGRVVETPQPRARMAVLAIAASLVLIVGSALYMVGRDEFATAPAGSPQSVVADGNATPADPVQSITDDLEAVVQHYESAIVKLEQAVKNDESSIDPETAAILTRNLPVIDQAISESRSALKVEPQSAPARDSLFEALRRKVDLLQDTIALMNEMRKGNSAGAAQLIDPGSKS